MDDHNIPLMATTAGGGFTLGGLLVGLAKWSFSRNITELDNRLTALNTSLTGLVARIEALERTSASRFEALERESRERDTALGHELLKESSKHSLGVQGVAADLRHISDNLNSIRTLVSELQRLFETTRDKQSEFYRGVVKETEERVMKLVHQCQDEVRGMVSRALTPARPRKR